MKNLEKIIKIGIYLIFLLPLVFTSQTMFPWHFGRVLIFQVLVEVLLLLTFLYFSLNKNKKFIKFNLLDWLILIFAFLQIITSVFGVNFIRSFWGDQQRAQGVFTWLHFTAFYLILRNFFISKKDWINLSLWGIFIAFISSFIAIFGLNFSFFAGKIDPASRISGLIGNPIFFAAYLIIPVFLSFVLFYFLKDDKLKYFSLFIGLFGLIALFLSQTRGAFVGLLAGMFIIWLGYLILGNSKKIKKYFISIGIIILLIFSFLYIFNQKSTYLNNNFPKLSNLFNISPDATTATTRLMAWDIAIKGWQDRPIFGWGPENFQDSFDKHYNPEFLNYSFKEMVWDKPHNYFLEVLNTMGVVSAFSYLAIIFCIIFYLIKIIKKTTEEKVKIAYIILGGGLAAYIVQNNFGIETFNSLHIWFFALAMLAFFFDYSKNKESKENSIKDKLIVIIALVLLVLTPFLVYKNYIFYKSSVFMGSAKDYAEIGSLYQWQKNVNLCLDVPVPFIWEQTVIATKNLSVFDGQGVLDKDILEEVAYDLENIYLENIEKYPTSFLMRFWAGQLYSFMGDYIDNKYFIDSEKYLQEASDLSPDQQTAAMVLAKTYLLQNKVQEGVAVLEKVVAADEKYEEPHWFLGIALMQAGEKERAIEELEKGKNFAINLTVNNAYYLIDVYFEQGDYEKIIPIYERLIEMNPENPQNYASLAATYIKLGDEENAVISLNKAVELQPELASEAMKFLEENNIDINKYK